MNGLAMRMLHAPGLAAERPIEVPLWLSVLGPRGHAVASNFNNGIIGPPHPTFPTAMIMSGTVLERRKTPIQNECARPSGPGVSSTGTMPMRPQVLRAFTTFLEGRHGAKRLTGRLWAMTDTWSPSKAT